MKDPVYECERCGDTLEKWQQGKVIWCTKCQKTWEDGFWEGVKAHSQIVSVCDDRELSRIMSIRAPYLVREGEKYGKR